MTEQIYYHDPYCRSFEATVQSCTPHAKKGWEIVLDRTAFYPEGGGQPGDIGTLNGVTVQDTYEKDGQIIHLASDDIAAGTKVTGTIDWNYRFDLMQNHSGEHIVSGIIHAAIGANNVGFHIGSQTVTMDIDQFITPEQLMHYEMLANTAIWKNITTEITYPDEKTLKTLDYRSKKELSGQVRIVTYPGYDVCACCALHVQQTGEIGLIKLISVQKHKSGSRIELLCGRRALQYINTVAQQNHEISVALSAKPLETASAVVRLKEENEKTALQYSALETTIFEQKACEMAHCGDVVLFEQNLAPFSVRKLAVSVMETCDGRCAVFSGDDQSGYKYTIGEKNGDVRSLIRELNQELHGRGGGKPFLAQGSVQATRCEIESFFNRQV